MSALTFLIANFLLLFAVSSVSAANPSLMFEPNKVSTSSGDSFTVDIIVDTAGQAVGGTGAKIIFDPNRLSVTSIQPGSIFADYPTASSDNALGRATLSGIVSSPKTLYTGKGVLGTITFAAKLEGNSTVRFDYFPGSTTDSNIAVTHDPGDILSEAGKLEVTITKSQTPFGGTSTNITSPSTPALVEPKKMSLLDKIRNALGLETAEGGATLDPYGPIPSQQPNTDPNTQQQLAQLEAAQKVIPRFYTVVVGLLVLVLTPVVLLVLRRKRRLKGVIPNSDEQKNKDEVTIVHRDI